MEKLAAALPQHAGCELRQTGLRRRRRPRQASDNDGLHKTGAIQLYPHSGDVPGVGAAATTDERQIRQVPPEVALKVGELGGVALVQLGGIVELGVRRQPRPPHSPFRGGFASGLSTTGGRR